MSSTQDGGTATTTLPIVLATSQCSLSEIEAYQDRDKALYKRGFNYE